MGKEGTPTVGQVRRELCSQFNPNRSGQPDLDAALQPSPQPACHSPRDGVKILGWQKRETGISRQQIIITCRCSATGWEEKKMIFNLATGEVISGVARDAASELAPAQFGHPRHT
ncbi:hypothetical protein ACFLZP_01225 [Patescibacteria group bacterium]